jgi:hypothetical protein
MTSIKAIVRNGRVETDAPLGLPDGTEVLIVPPDEGVTDIWADTPEGVRAWMDWLDSLEPLNFTPEEQSALQADRASRRAWELAHFEERAEKLKRLWE